MAAGDRAGRRCCQEPQFGYQADAVAGLGAAGGPGGVFGSVFRLVADSPLIGLSVHNLIVSNVPGPQAQLYFLGCEVEAMYPLGPLFHGCGLNVTAMSLNGKLNVGVISCPDLLPDLWRLVDDFDVALEELLECAGAARI